MCMRTRKRSQQIHLLLLGVATLVGSGCRTPVMLPDSPEALFPPDGTVHTSLEDTRKFSTEEACLEYWGPSGCVEMASPALVPPPTDTVVEPPPTNVGYDTAEDYYYGTLPAQYYPPSTYWVGWVGRAVGWTGARIVRRGFGSSAHFYGSALS